MIEDEAKEVARNDGAGASHNGTLRSVSLADNRIDSRELFHGAREITIAHGDDTYRLRLTAQNKLILTK
ncbi:MAG: hemin uptake protein HemP [Pseudolabrys sp.]|jgi:hemin uptake protein HemP